MKRILVTLLIAAALIGINFLLVNKFIGWQREKLQTEMTWEIKKFEIEMKKSCQGFAATTEDEGWKYKSCIKELKLNKDKVQTL